MITGTVRGVAIRVLWVVKGLGPGGAERLLGAAARLHDPREFDIDCAYVLPWKDHLAGELESAGVRTICLSRRRSDPRWPIRLAGLVRSGSYDVVHVHSPLPGSVARLATRSLKASERPGLVSTEHNRWETHRFPTRLLNRWTSRVDDVDFAVTDEVSDSMRGPAADRVITLRHGIDIDRVGRAGGERTSVRRELGIDDAEFVVGTVANFRPQKDYPNLLRAARILCDRGVPVRFVAVGQGPLEGEVRELRADLGVDEQVLLTGFRDDAVHVMGACDAFVLASAWEGLPVAVMEAVGLGLPVVATRVGGLAEQFDDPDDALLVPPGDPVSLASALQRVAQEPDLRQQLAEASRRKAPEFDIRRAVDRLELAYRTVARSRPPHPDPEASPRPKRSRPTPSLRVATPDDHRRIVELLGQSLGGDDDPRHEALFRWKHVENRFGPSPMWVATEDSEIVAVRAFLRWEFTRGGRRIRAVRAVDTATHPDHQGKGLFRALTLHGVEQMREEGVDFVFNTPNSQSRPGYLKMGWRDVGRVPAAVRFASPSGAATALRSRVPADRWSQELSVGVDVETWLDIDGPGDRWPVARDVREIRTSMDEDYLRWRFATPLLGYRVIDDGDAAAIVRARRRGSALEIACVASFGDVAAADRLAARACRAAGGSYVIRLGESQMSSAMVSLPGGGPMLTWRAVCDAGAPPLSNWALTLGDVELF